MLTPICLTNAAMCQGLGRLKGASPGQAFTVGLFSILDAYFDTDMEVLVKDLPLSDEVRSALVLRTGLLGQILNWVTQYERGDWDQLDDESPDPEPGPGE